MLVRTRIAVSYTHLSGETGDMIFNKYDAVCSDLDDPEEPELLPEELELLKKLDAEEKQD